MRSFLTRRSGALIFVCTATCFLLAACGPQLSTEQLLEQRSTERWAAYFSDDLKTVYGYLSPGYRSSVSFKQYQKNLLLMKVQWSKAEFVKSECTETTCKVQISLKYTVYGVLPGVKSYDGIKVIEESWVLVDGNWYLVPDN